MYTTHTALALSLYLNTQAHAAEQCFYQAGTYGGLTVSTSGLVCSNPLTYGGITGLHLGAGSTSADCTFEMSAGGDLVDVSTVRVLVTALTDFPSVRSEEAALSLDGVEYAASAGDIDNSAPTGGVGLVALPSGHIGSSGNDGRGTVRFTGAQDPIESLSISHLSTLGTPGGAVYLVCADDVGVPRDSDLDGIPDNVEGTADADADGTPNYLDPDSDNDTLQDIDEGVSDPDEDDTPNYLDLDSDGDGALDLVEGEVDTDVDTTPDYLDLDSDGDGLLDADEVSTGADRTDADTDNDGLSDSGEGELSTSPVDADSDDDGLSDGVEAALLLDPSDPDTDNDGLLDGVELSIVSAVPGGLSEGGGVDYTGTDDLLFVPDADPSTATDPDDDDSDDDGLLDGSEDTDGDGARSTEEGDPLEIDTDSDGINDGIESGLAAPEGLGTAEPFVPDADPSTATDPVDADSDDDGIADGDEDLSLDGAQDAGETDPSSVDTDGDGLQDGTESGLTAEDVGPETDLAIFVPDSNPFTLSDPTSPDTDAGTVGDGEEDIDHDGSIDPGECDPIDPADDLFCVDTDEDGLSDGFEAGLGTDPANPDTDADTLTDGDEVNTFGTDPASPDTDAGGVADGVEIESGTNPLDPADDQLTTPGTGETGETPPDFGDDDDAEDDDGPSDRPVDLGRPPVDTGYTTYKDVTCACGTSPGRGSLVVLLPMLLALVTRRRGVTFS